MSDITPGEVRGWLIGVGGDVPAPIPKTDSDGRAPATGRPEDVVQGSAIGGLRDHEHLSQLREDHLQALRRLVGWATGA